MDAGHEGREPLEGIGHRIERDDGRAQLDEPSRDMQGRRLPEVVGVRLEGDPEQGDPGPRDRPAEELGEAINHPLALSMVDLGDRREERCRKARLDGRGHRHRDLVRQA